MSEIEAESFDTVIMLVMMTGAANLEEQLASMKATLDRLSKKNAEKDAQIKRQNDQIEELTKSWKRSSLKLLTRACVLKTVTKSHIAVRNLTMTAKLKRTAP